MDHPPPSSEDNPPPEPDQKRPRMSAATTSDDEECNTTAAAGSADGPIPEKKIRYKRRKIAIFFAYCGVGYQGMQKNPGAKTIEGDLEEALFHAGAVPEQDRGCPKRFDWARSARTDKGVSAVGQVVSGRFYVDPPGLIERLNSILPPQIRIFGYKRVTGSFNAKKFCDRRRYVYLIPVFALNPCAHRDRESVMASLGSDSELAKCLECSERGRKVIGIMGKRSFESENDKKSDSDISSNILTAIPDDETCSNGHCGNATTDSIQAPSEEEETVNGETKPQFTYGEKEKQRFNNILKHFEGTHNFHNFTTRTKAEDPSARRFIISFSANTTVTVESMEFIKCEIVGQSFMLHQIRKMIGIAVAIMRNCAPESLIQTALKQLDYTLDECFFTSYNQKWKDSHEELSMKAYVDEAKEFKMKNVYSHISSTEYKEGVVGLWLHSLNYQNYSDLNISSDGDGDGDGDGGGSAIEE